MLQYRSIVKIQRRARRGRIVRKIVQSNKPPSATQSALNKFRNSAKFAPRQIPNNAKDRFKQERERKSQIQEEVHRASLKTLEKTRNIKEIKARAERQIESSSGSGENVAKLKQENLALNEEVEALRRDLLLLKSECANLRDH